MSTVVAIVEGDGEVAALPLLLRRICEWQSPGSYVDIRPPIRVRRDRFLNREDEFRRHLLLAANKCSEQGWILVLLDADNDCPAELGRSILERAHNCVPHRRISVVLPNREYEAWFIASQDSLNGRRGFVAPPHGGAMDAETIRDAKGWMSAHIPGGKYRERTDQPAFSACLDLQQAFENSRSFRKLTKEWRKQQGRLPEPQ